MWQLAWRNLWRNRTRTLITLFAISATYALQLLSYGIGEHSYVMMKHSAVKTAGGSVLVHADGYWENRSGEFIVEDGEAIRASLADLPGVAEAVPRVIIQGLLSSTRGRMGAALYGIDVEKEAALDDRSRFLVEGSFLGPPDPNASRRVRMRKPIVLGRGVVDELKIELGDRVVLTATDPEGEMAYALFHLSGILETGSKMMDKGLAYTTIEAAQSALNLGGGLTQVGVVLEDDTRRDATKAAVEAALAGRTGLELLTWDEAMPELVAWVEVDYRINAMFLYVILLIVAFGIANTFLMAVMERIRELGLLGALGMTPGRIARLVMAETFILALIAIALGFALGYGGHYYFMTEGVELTSLGEMEWDVSGVLMEDMTLRSRFNAWKWGSATVAVFILVMISAMYPAYRATRVAPATAMRTYE